MKLLIEKNVLLESLTNVMRAISPRNIIPILNGVMFNLTDEGLYITASDSDLTIRNFIPKDKIKSNNVNTVENKPSEVKPIENKTVENKANFCRIKWIEPYSNLNLTMYLQFKKVI